MQIGSEPLCLGLLRLLLGFLLDGEEASENPKTILLLSLL